MKSEPDVEVWTPRGRVALSRAATGLLIENCLRDDDSLSGTFDAFGEAFAGRPVQLPENELDTFRERLGSFLDGFGPVERSHEVQELDRLRDALEP